jgi:hypothetical protein
VGSLAFAQEAAAALAHAASAGQLEEVNTYTYRTADYMLSTAQDYRKGSRGNQYHSWQATFGLDAIVFTTHPGSAPSQTLDWSVDREPGSWTGTASQPRSAQHENVGIHIYAPQYTVLPDIFEPLSRYEPYTHAYFPQDHFDEVVRDGHWTFGRKDGGYVALYSYRLAEYVDHGPTVAANGMTQPFDLVARVPGDACSENGVSVTCAANVWIVECASAADWASFEAFQTAILAAPLAIEAITTGLPPKTRRPLFEVAYESPSQGPMTFSWLGPLTVDGAPVPIASYPRMSNPWTHTEFEDRDLFLHDPEHGTSLVHDFERGRRFLLNVE